MDRILEIGGYAAGYCGRLFAQTGHEVVRVDRGIHEPAWVSPRAMDIYLHSDKRIVQTKNEELIEELANASDVVICEMSSADALQEIKFDSWKCPVKVALTPFGRSGPYRNRAATSSTLLAMGGYTALMGDPDREPLTLPGHFVDFQTGGFAFSAANAVRFADQVNSIDIGKLEVVLALSQFTTVMWTCAEYIRTRHGNDFWSVVPTNLFRCQDGWVYMNIVPGFWDAFTTFLDMPELVLDSRFRTNGGRMEHRDVLHEIIADVLKDWTRADIQRRATECRIPLGAALSFDEVLQDEHLQVRDMWVKRKTDEGNTVKVPRLPWISHEEFPAS